ncbi:MAG: MBL fold metallo-hydrolase [Longimicrobiales bacterium]
MAHPDRWRLPESAPRIAASIESLGFRTADVKLILNSHPHFDHAGGIAALQSTSGATVAASTASALVLERGASQPSDPLYGDVPSLPPVPDVRVIADGEMLRVDSLALTTHFTPGHTPGGTRPAGTPRSSASRFALWPRPSSSRRESRPGCERSQASSYSSW